MESSSATYAALGISAVTSTIIFVRRVLVLNRWCFPPSSLQFGTWLLSLLSGALFWVSIQSVQGDLRLQIASGITSTAISWGVLVLLVNEDMRVPTPQQAVSLVFYVLTEASILIQARLLLN